MEDRDEIRALRSDRKKLSESAVRELNGIHHSILDDVRDMRNRCSAGCAEIENLRSFTDWELLAPIQHHCGKFASTGVPMAVFDRSVPLIPYPCFTIHTGAWDKIPRVNAIIAIDEDALKNLACWCKMGYMVPSGRLLISTSIGMDVDIGFDSSIDTN